MAGTLFGKPRDQVIKHPGAFSASARRAGMSTHAFAQKHAGDSGTLGRRARLAKAFETMRGRRGR